MRRTIRKIFWVWDFDKEEKWLNEMAAKGFCLVSVGFCGYEFEDCIPGEFGIKMEMLENRTSHPESRKYIEFLEETGVEQVGSRAKWIYLKKKKSDGEFELFSDNESRIRHLTRILRFVGILGALNLYWAIYNLFLFFAWDSYMNLCGILNLLIEVLSMVGFYKLWKRRKYIKSEQQLFE